MPNVVNNPEPDTAPQDAPAPLPLAAPLHPPTTEEIAAIPFFRPTLLRDRSDTPPFPPNPWQCFRHVLSRRLQFDVAATDRRALAVRLARLWRELSEEERRVWHRVAEEKNEEWRRMHPDHHASVRRGRRRARRGGATA